MSLKEFRNSKYYQALTSESLEVTYWDSETKTTKKRTYKEACAIWWSNLTNINKKIIQEIPNFAPDIFFDITGIDVLNSKPKKQ